jgi:hypothetical protein
MAVKGIETMLCRYVRLLMDPEMLDVSMLVFREQIEPTPAFQRLWDGAIGRMIGLLTRLVALAEGEQIPGYPHHIRALALFGQVYVFRAARAAVSYHLERHEDFDEATLIDNVESTVTANVRRMFAS